MKKKVCKEKQEDPSCQSHVLNDSELITEHSGFHRRKKCSPSAGLLKILKQYALLKAETHN